MSKIASLKITEHTFLPLSVVSVIIAAVISGTFWVSGLSKEVQKHEEQINTHTDILKERERMITAIQDIQDIKQLLRDQDQIHLKRNERIYNQINELKEIVYRLDGKIEVITATQPKKAISSKK